MTERQPAIPERPENKGEGKYGDFGSKEEFKKWLKEVVKSSSGDLPKDELYREQIQKELQEKYDKDDETWFMERYGSFGSFEEWKQRHIDDLNAQLKVAESWIGAKDRQRARSEKEKIPIIKAKIAEVEQMTLADMRRQIDEHMPEYDPTYLKLALGEGYEEEIPGTEKNEKFGKRAVAAALAAVIAGGALIGTGSNQMDSVYGSNENPDDMPAASMEGTTPVNIDLDQFTLEDGTDGGEGNSDAETAKDSMEVHEAREWTDGGYQADEDPFLEAEGNLRLGVNFGPKITAETPGDTIEQLMQQMSGSTHEALFYSLLSNYALPDGGEFDELRDLPLNTRELSRYANELNHSGDDERVDREINAALNTIWQHADSAEVRDVRGYTSVWLQNGKDGDQHMYTSMKVNKENRMVILKDKNGENLLDVDAALEAVGGAKKVAFEQLGHFDEDSFEYVFEVGFGANCGGQLILICIAKPITQETVTTTTTTETHEDDGGGGGEEETPPDDGEDETPGGGTPKTDDGDTPKSGDVEDYQRPGMDDTTDSGTGEKPIVSVVEEAATPPAKVDVGTPEQQAQEPSQEVETPAAGTTTETLPTTDQSGDGEQQPEVRQDTEEANQSNTEEVRLPESA
ncbi:MAG: hypothetical protein LBH36_01505 [Candidatus Nomurabacteria bacterium]|jgi:hypothetical protein|nr:hypothetical protein [Candidatus Nomurabacteria bacterium]